MVSLDAFGGRSRAAADSPSGAAAVRPRIIGEAAIVAGLLFFYDRIAELAATHPVRADYHGAAVLRAESQAHMAVEGDLNRWLSGHRASEFLAVGYYQLMHLSVALTVLVWCYVRRPDAYRAARNALVGINLVGLAVFALYPVAPPRSIRAGFLDSVADVWFVHSKPDHFGALPSLHLAWAVWASVVGLAVVTSAPLRLLLVLHPVITAVVVVATANHYLVDVATGAVLALASVLVTARWFGIARTGQRREVSQRHRDPLVAAGASAPPS